MADRPFAGHINDEGRVQTIYEHLSGTAELAEEFAAGFDSEELAYISGLYHDIGKYSKRFQKRIYEGGNPVDHSTAGAIEINKGMPRIGKLLAYCIAGHHGGLPDGGSAAHTKDEPTLCGRLKRTPEPYAEYQQDVKSSLPQGVRLPIKPMEQVGFTLSFYTRMLFSCLTDADFLDTERFMAGTNLRQACESLKILEERLEAHLENLKKRKDASREINQKRGEVLQYCITAALWEKGLYSLTVPTGGGKTIASLAFALKHACHRGLNRVIYVIPYNSIIEQNATVLKNIIGKENVLEHHSNFNYDDLKEDGAAEKQKLASENWDMPVIVTTTVQFFESLFANKTSKCRKLHNLSNAVIIFDEVQMLPLNYLLPCIRAIAELVHNYGSTAVLCSATQPSLKKYFPKQIQINEICPEVDSLYQFFKRTEITFAGELENGELARSLNEKEQVLCIVNTRKHAQHLFALLHEEGRYHLSTLMYPQHRKAVLSEIRQRLKDNLPCRVVSTSLIEAGVDVDFPWVYRGEAGVDSIIQAAGRCNREARRKLGNVVVFRPSSEYRKYMPDMLKGPAKITDAIAHLFPDISSPEAIESFFTELYSVSGQGIDLKRIVQRFEDGYAEDFNFPFASVASEFRLIDNNTRAVLIAETEEAQKLAGRLRSGERNRNLMRAVQQYCVNVYEPVYQSLYGGGSIEVLDEALAVLTKHEKYSDQMGLDVGIDTGIGIFI